MKNKVTVSLAGVHTHTLCLVNNKRLVRKAGKHEELNKIKIYKQEKKPIKKDRFFFPFFLRSKIKKF